MVVKRVGPLSVAKNAAVLYAVLGLIIGGLFFHWLMTVDFKKISFRPLRLFPKNEFEQKILQRTSILQYLTFQFFAVSVLLALPVKLILRLVLTIKYVWVTPWFNI